MDLTLRLKLLKDGAQIDEDTYNNLLKIIESFKKDFQIELSEENGGMFITHLAVALERIKKKELVEPIEELIFEEVRNDKNFKKANDILESLEKDINISVPEVERPFILLFLVSKMFNLRHIQINN